MSPQSETICLVVGTLADYPAACVAAESVRRHHPHWTLVWCMADSLSSKDVFNPLANGCFDRNLTIEALSLDLAWIFEHDQAGLRMAVRSAAAGQLLNDGAQRVICVSPGMVFFNPFVHIESELDQRSVVVVPSHDGNGASASRQTRQTRSCPLIAIRNDARGRSFMSAWQASRGQLPESQRSGHVAAPDGGQDISVGDLWHRPLRISAQGNILAGHELLRSFCFAVDEDIVKVSALLAGQTEALELWHWFHLRMVEHAIQGGHAGEWLFASYEDGARIPDGHRLIWRRRDELSENFTNPFQSGPGTFQALMAQRPQ